MKKLSLDDLKVQSFQTAETDNKVGGIFFTQFCWNTEYRSCQVQCDMTIYPVVCY